MKKKKEKRELTLKQLEKRLKIANTVMNLFLALAILGCILMLVIARTIPISYKKMMPFYITWAGVGFLIVSISSEIAIKIREKMNQIDG